MTSAEGSLFDAVPQPTNDVLSDDVPAKSGDGSGEGSLSADELQGLTVPLLKGRLKARGLRVGGLKAELVARLLDAPAEPSPAALDADADADADALLGEVDSHVPITLALALAPTLTYHPDPDQVDSHLHASLVVATGVHELEALLPRKILDTALGRGRYKAKADISPSPNPNPNSNPNPNPNSSPRP